MDPSIQRGILLCRLNEKNNISNQKNLKAYRQQERPPYRLLEPGDEVIPVLFLLQTSECHLGAGDVLHGVIALGHMENSKTVAPFWGSRDIRREYSLPIQYPC